MFQSVRQELKLKGDLNIICIGDIHFPYVDELKLGKVLSLIKELKPSVVVQIGDLYDFYTFSRFARSVNFLSPQQEIEKGRKLSIAMWNEIHKLVPKARLFQLQGNHCLRIWKKLLDKLPEYETLVGDTIRDLFTFPYVATMPTNTSELVINDIIFSHGWKTQVGAHVRYFGQSAVTGHSHKGGVVYVKMKDKVLFELNCGFIGDEDKLPLMYGDTKTTPWIPGIGHIDKYGPRFIVL